MLSHLIITNSRMIKVDIKFNYIPKLGRGSASLKGCFNKKANSLERFSE